MAKFRLSVFNTQPPQLFFGGVERRITETTKRLQNQADIAIYCGTKAGFKQPTTIDGAKFIPCKSTDKIFPLDNWSFNRSLCKKAASIDTDVYEAHTVSGYGFPQTLKKLCVNKPFIHTIHGVLADEYEQAKTGGYSSFRDRMANYFMNHLAKLEEQTAQNATLIVTISRYSLEKIHEHYKVDTSKIKIVPNGVDTEKFKPTVDTTEAKKLFGIGNEPCVLFVGSLIPRKGLLYLIKAAKKVVEENAATKFMIVGDGPLRKQLMSATAASNLARNFIFTGNVEEAQLSAIYNCADVFVLPSVQEGQGIVLLEAQASGKPVVAFNIGGVNETVRDGETGFLVAPGSSDELATGLLKLIDNDSLFKSMGANGRRFIIENFTWDICAQRMLEVYREALTI